MRFLSLAFLSLAAYATAAPSGARGQKAGDVIKGQYIVTFKKVDSLVPRNLDQLIDSVLTVPGSASFAKPAVLQKYDFGTLQGFAAKISDDAVLEQLKSHDEVASVEEDQVISIAGTQTTDAGLWGLDAIDGTRSNTYNYPDAAGSGVDVYVIDTGCQTNHPDLSGRATWGASFTGETSTTDGNGHGTHVAGTIGGKTYGVAKKANIICVRVLSASGSGSNSGVIAGVNWVAQQARSKGRPAVANMSLGGGKSTALDQAAQALINSNVALAVAAGNTKGFDACTGSPSGVRAAYTVGASDTNNKWASFSSEGACVDIIAPGVNIKSSWPTSSTNTISGTSMATPHVAGALALAYSQQSFANPAAAFSYLTSRARSGQITGVPSNTVNRFLRI